MVTEMFANKQLPARVCKIRERHIEPSPATHGTSLMRITEQTTTEHTFFIRNHTCNHEYFWGSTYASTKHETDDCRAYMQRRYKCIMCAAKMLYQHFLPLVFNVLPRGYSSKRDR